MQDPWRFFDRREFLRRGAYLIPALHTGLLGTTPLWSREPTAARSPMKFRRLELQSHRIEEQHRFYRDILGLDTRLDGDALEVAAGSTRLRFVPAASGSEPMYHFAFMIPENKLERAVQWMDGKAPLQPNRQGKVVFHFRRWNAHSIYFFDPAGNLAEFIAHHELPNASEGEFGPQDILHTCEIGLVTPDLGRLLRELEQRLGLTPYFPASENFAPVGDRHGLFICVPQNRIWLSTDLRAQTHSVEATVLGNQEALVQIPDLPFRIQTVI